MAAETSSLLKSSIRTTLIHLSLHITHSLVMDSITATLISSLQRRRKGAHFTYSPTVFPARRLAKISRLCLAWRVLNYGPAIHSLTQSIDCFFILFAQRVVANGSGKCCCAGVLCLGSSYCTY